MSDDSADVVVIGAGHNSLIGAAYLAAAGLDVVVLEEQAQVGGDTITEELTLPGFRHDSCSSAHVLIQSNPLVKDDELGLAALGLRYVHTDPAVVLPLPGGDATAMSRDREATAAELGRWSKEDGAAYLSLLAEWEGGLAASHGAWNAGRLDPATSPADAEYAVLRRRSATDAVAERFTHQRSRDLMTWLSFATITDPRTHRAPASSPSPSLPAALSSAGRRPWVAPAPSPTRSWRRSPRTAVGSSPDERSRGSSWRTAAPPRSSPTTASAGRRRGRCCHRHTSPTSRACSRGWRFRRTFAAPRAAGGPG
jgi:phytoene dehydrogenase-like protein